MDKRKNRGARYGHGLGYDARRFRALLAFSSDAAPGRTLERALHVSALIARGAVEEGRLTREEIYTLAKKYQWTQKELCAALFSDVPETRDEQKTPL